jgi:hypothetical protein
VGITRVKESTRAELEARREEILARLDVSLEELTRRVESSSLVGDEWEAWEELEDIAFLLGDHAA